ncbi:hypothetical protein MICAF_640015 [Microcystis aeruginosa PCC 9807]|uniref:Uncharacterized protein n=1 Tax=Microcystis aeruginosa PCC 9807 TaxID=1160283 RepID=I4HDS8_MICAE|nr:hypothetical protein [Microcystis aeruginosa]CCI20202.1 hypothetical protein MICAF_640015 [Microcystis aeruginosa PCC 9807]
MATFTENDLKELKDFILGQFKEVNSKIDKLSEEVNNLKERLENGFFQKTRFLKSIM